MSLKKPFISAYDSVGRDICITQQLEDYFNMLTNEGAISSIRKELQNIRKNEQLITKFKGINTRNIIANVQIQKQAYNRLLDNLSIRKVQRDHRQEREKIKIYQLAGSQKSQSKNSEEISEQLQECNKKEPIDNPCQSSLNNEANLQFQSSGKCIIQLSKNQLAQNSQLMNKISHTRTFDTNLQHDSNKQQIFFRQPGETMKHSYIDAMHNQIIDNFSGKKGTKIKKGKLNGILNNNINKQISHKSIGTRNNKINNNLSEGYQSNKLPFKPSNKYVIITKPDRIFSSAFQKILNRVELSQIVYKDAQMRNIKSQIEQLSKAYQIQQRGRKEMRDKINRYCKL